VGLVGVVWFVLVYYLGLLVGCFYGLLFGGIRVGCVWLRVWVVIYWCGYGELYLLFCGWSCWILIGMFSIYECDDVHCWRSVDRGFDYCCF